MKRAHNDNYVNFIPRFIAELIDCQLWLLIWIYFLWRWSSLTSVEDLGVRVITDVVWFIIPLSLIQSLYRPLMLSKFKATLGKMLVGIEVVKPDEKSLSLKRALFREWVAKPLNGVLFGLSFFTILLDVKHQAIHDHLAYTVVVPKSPKLVSGVIVLIALLSITLFSIWQIGQMILSNTQLLQNISEILLLN